MEKLLQIADQHAVMSAPAESQIDEEKFLGFMLKNPVSSFFFYITGWVFVKKQRGKGLFNFKVLYWNE